MFKSEAVVLAILFESINALRCQGLSDPLPLVLGLSLGMAQAEKIRIVNEALANNPNYLNWLAIDKLNENIQLVISDGSTILNLEALKAN